MKARAALGVLTLLGVSSCMLFRSLDDLETKAGTSDGGLTDGAVTSDAGDAAVLDGATSADAGDATVIDDASVDGGPGNDAMTDDDAGFCASFLASASDAGFHACVDFDEADLATDLTAVPGYSVDDPTDGGAVTVTSDGISLPNALSLTLPAISSGGETLALDLPIGPSGQVITHLKLSFKERFSVPACGSSFDGGLVGSGVNTDGNPLVTPLKSYWYVVGDCTTGMIGIEDGDNNTAYVTPSQGTNGWHTVDMDIDLASSAAPSFHIDGIALPTATPSAFDVSVGSTTLRVAFGLSFVEGPSPERTVEIDDVAITGTY